MSMGLLAWSVLCIGVGLVFGAGFAGDPDVRTGIQRGVVRGITAGVGMGCLLWAIGVGVWMLAGLVF